MTRFSYSYSLLALISAVSFCFLLSPMGAAFINPVNAQIPVSGGDLVLSSSIPNPLPGQTVTVTVRSYSIDINAASISWSVNGSVQKKGTGLTSIEVAAPALGKTARVTVTAVTADGRVANNSTTIGSSAIDLVQEANGYIPPFFGGKLEPTYQNTVKVTAIPHLAGANGRELDPKSLIYEWKRNDSVLESESGYGKQSLLVAGDVVPRSYAITVEVRSRDGTVNGEATTVVNFGSPSIVFYVHDPQYGPMFNKALINTLRIGSEKESGVRAVTYGFNRPSDGVGSLSLSWLVNGQKRTDLGSHEELTLRAPEGAGSSFIRLTIRNMEEILQGADSELNVIFSGSEPEAESNVSFQ